MEYKFYTCFQWKSSEFKTFIEDKLRFCTLHFSVRVDLWPYDNVYVRPVTRARKKFNNLTKNFSF